METITVDDEDTMTTDWNISTALAESAGSRLRVALAMVCLLSQCGCSRNAEKIAVIPQTTAVTIWEAEHAGADFAASKSGVQLYWNAPTSEDDIRQQEALIERIIDEHYSALVLAPDQSLGLMAPVKRALAHNMRIVIVASSLPLPPGSGLSYIVNDDQASGRMAASRIGEILHGSGRVAVLGVSPESLSSLTILHSFETTLEEKYPGITLSERRFGTHNGTDAQQSAEEVLSSDRALDAIFTLSSVSSDGAAAALQSRGLTGHVKLVGFEQSAELANLVRLGSMDSLIAENTYEMGYRAVQLLAQPRSSAPQEIRLQPTLLTRENIASPEVRSLISTDWSRARGIGIDESLTEGSRR
jgi:ribose transport system substrate-binding protein